MKKNSNIILSAAAVLCAFGGASVNAQDIQVSGGWGNNFQQSGNDLGEGSSAEEDALLQSLYNEEEDEELTRMLQSEDYIFPSSITDNWHITLQLGANNSWGSYDSHQSWGKRTSFAAAFSIGKYLTPVNDVRIQFFYGRGTGVRGRDAEFIDPLFQWNKYAPAVGNKYQPKYNYHYDRQTEEQCHLLGMVDGHTHGQVYESVEADYHSYNWHTVGLYTAYMPNFTNLIMGYDPDRKFTISGVMGIGLEHTWSYTDDHLSIISVWAEKEAQSVPRNLVSLQFGLQCEYVLNDRWHINLEADENFLDDSYDGLVSDQNWDGHLNLMAGVTYFLKGKFQDGRIQNRTPFDDKYLNYTERIYRNREAIEDAMANQQETVNVVNVTKDVTYTLISFDEGAMEVPRLQQNNVFQTAETYRRIPNSRIFITNSNKKDDSMFHQRAWSISKLLNQRWQIPLEDVWVDADESHIQQLQIPECKHYIIFIINEE